MVATSPSPRRAILARWADRARCLFGFLFGPAWTLKLPLLIVVFLIGARPDFVPDAIYSATGISPLQLPHADTLVITLGAEELARGGDPLIRNPDDPWGRSLNYPRLVGQLAVGAGLDRSDTALLARLIAAAFVLGLAALLRRLDLARTAFTALLILSPPVLLGLERANFDLLVFGVLTAACFYVPRLAPLCVVPLCALKIFPVFALTGALPAGRPAPLRIWAFAGLGCLTAIWIALPDLAAIRQATPFRVLNSWGVATLPLRIDARSWLAEFRLGTFLVFISGVTWALLRRRATGTTVDTETEDAAATIAASIAAGIFAGSYFLGTNFDYRMVFLLPAAPLLLRIASNGHNQTDRTLSRLTLALFLVTFWGDALARHTAAGAFPFWIIDEFAPVALLASCGWILGRSVRFPGRFSSHLTPPLTTVGRPPAAQPQNPIAVFERR